MAAPAEDPSLEAARVACLDELPQGVLLSVIEQLCVADILRLGCTCRGALGGTVGIAALLILIGILGCLLSSLQAHIKYAYAIRGLSWKHLVGVSFESSLAMS
jgi:hypothetical protein